MGNDVIVALANIVLHGYSRDIALLLNKVVGYSVQISEIHPDSTNPTFSTVILKRIGHDHISKAKHIDRNAFKTVIETRVIEDAPIPVVILRDADGFVSYGETV